MDLSSAGVTCAAGTFRINQQTGAYETGGQDYSLPVCRACPPGYKYTSPSLPQRHATLVNIKTLLAKLVALPVRLARHAPTEMCLLIYVQEGMHLIQLKQRAFLKLQHPVLQKRVIMNLHGLIPESL